MPKKPAFLFILMLLSLFTCGEKQSDLDFEKSVVYEIFPALMDSLYFDSRSYPPPPPPFILDEKGNYVGLDSVARQNLISTYKQKLVRLKADSIKLVMLMNDSTSLLSRIGKSTLKGHFYNQDLKLDTTNISNPFKIDINQLNADKKLVFKYRSEFPSDRDLWRKNDSFNINATTWISRIQFDLQKTFGVMEGGIGCGIYCGRAVRVYIKKEKDKWIIDEIEDYGEVL